MTFKQEVFQATLLNFSDQPELAAIPQHFFGLIPSTNQKLWEILDQGAKPPLVAIAAQQSAGRGQWGRQWDSPLGGLYLSLALEPNIAITDSFHLTLSTAWGIAMILRSYQIPVLLKWPNDLILQGQKLGGIKTEVRGKQGKIVQAVIGVGINWTNSVPATGIKLASFCRSQGISTINSLEMLAAIALKGLLSGYQGYSSRGIEDLLPEYLAILDSLGQTILLKGCSGQVIGVTSQGELRVRLNSPGAATETFLKPGQISLGYETENRYL